MRQRIGMGWNVVPRGRGGESPSTVTPNSAMSSRIADWLRIGYRAAFKRYRGNCDNAVYLLRQILHQVKEVNAANDVEFGDKLQVSASIKQREVRVRYLPAPREAVAD